jgi:hypothetical protein
VKKIPLIGNLLVKIYSRLCGVQDFKTSKTYWEERYKKGGNSGPGSYNNLAEFKGEIISEFASKNKIETTIEFGCGDGNQLRYFDLKNYIGFDVSESAIALCKNLYQSDSSKQFELLGAYNGEKADLTLSLDVIYHLIEDEVYLDYMEKLFSSSNKFVIVYSSDTDENIGVAAHVKHRKFSSWIHEHAAEFKLVGQIPNKYPFDGDGNRTSFADFYIFKKEGN